MPFIVQVNSDASAVLESIKGFPPAMQVEIARALDLENQLTIAHSQQFYLTGPRPMKLGVVTNRLRGSLNAPPAVATATTVSSKIGTNVEYAGVHEHGFTGQVTVRQHTRQDSRFNVLRSVGGIQPEVSLETGRIRRRKAKTEVAAQGFVTVRQHTRQMQMPARPFLEPAINDRLGAYGTAVSEAILAAWNGGRS